MVLLPWYFGFVNWHLPLWQVPRKTQTETIVAF